MANLYDLVIQLTSEALPDYDRPRLLSDFAYQFGWQPSDRLAGLAVADFANAHLVVEHGLENTAVITFLRGPWRYAELERSQKTRLLNISYNNLVDWHIQVERDSVSFVYNRINPPRSIERADISRSNVDTLRSDAFERVTGRKPSPNLPALDDALINTISLWKRNLSAELGYAIPNDRLSALFNAIILVRAIEDNERFRSSSSFNPDTASSKVLLQVWRERTPLGQTPVQVLTESLRRLIPVEIPPNLISPDLLGSFDRLDPQTLFAVLSDFYRNKYAPYEYDFSLMSKHALSRVYEHYVSILRLEESHQLALPSIPRLPQEERDKAYGSVYTPQFVARFFGRYLREQMPPRMFRHIRVTDPACGSGMFLRTLLELQCDPSQDGVTTDLIEEAFGNVLGVDADQNACQATRLSLTLLYLLLTNQLPQSLAVIPAEAIDYFQQHAELRDTYDAVIANPPFVSLTTQAPLMRKRVADFMDSDATGRIDMYLAFLKIGLELLKPGGYGLFVVPHSFLLARQADGMRKLIAKSCWIRCVADLSAIRVFEDTGSYIVLLIFQKKPVTGHDEPNTMVIKCQDFVGQALQDAVEGRHVETPFYSIYEIRQQSFHKDEWLILPPAESAIERRFASLPTLDAFLEIRQGFVSGADDVFVVASEHIPPGEERIFVPFLRDREMKLYTVPDSTSQYLFYPFVAGNKITEEALREDFPRTWDYLISHRRRLEERRSLTKYKRAWWEPMWPRPPEHMMRPKIISPHLVLVPRFAFDRMGRYAVSRAPILYPKQTGAEDDLLRLFVAVLNSTACYWYIAGHSHKYRGGYAMLEPKTLAKTPVPDPANIPPGELRRLLQLVELRTAQSTVSTLVIDRQIDTLVADFYDLSASERRALGMEDLNGLPNH